MKPLAARSCPGWKWWVQRNQATSTYVPSTSGTYYLRYLGTYKPENFGSMPDGWYVIVRGWLLYAGLVILLLLLPSPSRLTSELVLLWVVICPGGNVDTYCCLARQEVIPVDVSDEGVS